MEHLLKDNILKFDHFYIFEFAFDTFHKGEILARLRVKCLESNLDYILDYIFHWRVQGMWVCEGALCRFCFSFS